MMIDNLRIGYAWVMAKYQRRNSILDTNIHALIPMKNSILGAITHTHTHIPETYEKIAFPGSSEVSSEPRARGSASCGARSAPPSPSALQGSSETWKGIRTTSGPSLGTQPRTQEEGLPGQTGYRAVVRPVEATAQTGDPSTATIVDYGGGGW